MSLHTLNFKLGLCGGLFFASFLLFGPVFADTETIDTLTNYAGSCGGTLSEGWNYIGDNDDYEGSGTTLSHASGTMDHISSLTWYDRAGGGSGLFPCAGCSYYVRICSTDFPFADHDVEAGNYVWDKVRNCTIPGFHLEREATFIAPAVAFATSTKTWDLTAVGDSIYIGLDYWYLVMYQPDLAGSHVVSIANWQCSSVGDPFQADGQIEHHSGSGGYSINKQREWKLKIEGSGQPSGVEDVEIIELPDFTGTAQVGMDSFFFPEKIECQISDTNCKITIQYRYEDIGKMVLLMPQEATSTLDYADMVENLPDQYLLKYDLYPTVRSSARVDTYRYFLYDDSIGTGELFADTKVYWVTATSSSEDTLLGTVWGYFKRMFPLSLYFDVNDSFERAQIATGTPIDVNLNDVLVDPAYTASGTLFSAHLISDNLPLWNTHILPFQKWLFYILTFLSLLGVMKLSFGAKEE